MQMIFAITLTYLSCRFNSNLNAILSSNFKSKNNLGIKVIVAKLIDMKVVSYCMENENITNHFEWAIMLLKHQFDKDPYSLTTDQIEVLKLHHQIEIDNEVEE